MRSRGTMAVVFGALLLAGCGHTHAAENTGGAAPAPGAPDHESAPDRTVKSSASPRSSTKPGDAGAVPVATSPDALLVPGAYDQIRQKLVAGGLMKEDDASLSAGLRRFQEKHDLPMTGMADHATVAKLGLDPGKIFRHDDPH
jgi:Putative peptidoglycan binding domain